jgi:acetoin utilization deacetylase AcuC-like enzyme
MSRQRHDSGASVASIPPPLLVDDPVFDRHQPIGYHPERPERLAAGRAAVARMQEAGTSFERVASPEASLDDLARVHDPRFVEALEKLRGKRGLLDPDTYVSAESIAAAKRAAGGVVTMVDAMLDAARPGVALVRPPGHHACPDHAMGFCLINNIAVAAAHARSKGLGKVAIVDFDVHHGNGTQEMFYRDPSVLYVSLHQYPFYPGTGSVDEVGEGAGEGFTVNIPLVAGGGDGVYAAAFDRVVVPVLAEFAPDLVLVSAGFDGAARDPLAEMTLSSRGYGYMGGRLADQAARSAGGRLGLVLEGGYDLVALESGLSETLHAVLDGTRLDVSPTNDSADVERAVRSAKRYWKTV